ncbi:MAG: recombinase family protein [Rikenellaceae bacterium]|nr:recombinase family protein [Rikenellaceae bacterium]
MNKNCYIWTRVSTKHQEENGASLDDQKCRCEKYAQEHGYTIKGYFGGKHESAKTPGKLIKDMISAIKRDKSVKYIIVNQADRFSRNAGQAINIINDLNAQGVIIVEALSGTDTSTPEGVMMMQVKLSLAQWDNTNRTNKFVSGRKHCMESGVWIGKRPLGYDKDGKSLNSQYTINATGKLIRKAFKWKLQGVDNFRIMDRLSAMGLNVSKQKLHKILTNPFYAGKIVSKFTDGEIVDGKHPPIISWIEFVHVQDILSGKTGVYKHQKETPQFPLKRHIRCAYDGTPMTAYTVKKKNKDYYKCNQSGCCNNISATKLHALYEELLNSYSIPANLREVFCSVIRDMLVRDNDERKETLALLRKQSSELKNKINSCKVRYGTGDIDDDVYTTTIESLQSKLAKNELELSKAKENLSNLDAAIYDTASTCCKLGSLWRNAELELSEKIQNLLFPSGILWDKEIGNYRTINENKALSVILRLSECYKNKKEENSLENSSFLTECG